MKTNRQKVQIATMTAFASLATAGAAFGQQELPRGADIGELAANCNIGPFQQTSKAGGYNVLCNVMQDSEKCLAYLKRHFSYDGDVIIVEPAENAAKAQYCLDTLKKDLGLTID